jgi:preprotein translocase subunit SecF
MIRPLRLVPDDTAIRFMRGRFAGLITSAILSIASIVLFFYPGLNYGVDFSGGVVAELRLAKAEDHAALRSAFDQLHFGSVSVQEFGSARDVLVRLDRQTADETAQQAIKAMLAAKFPGTEIRRLEVVGARVSQELFRSGLLATRSRSWPCSSTSGSVLTGSSVSASSPRCCSTRPRQLASWR